jgi:hypothetical protein
MRRTLCTLATVGLGFSLVLGTSAAAAAAATVTTAQCQAAGGTVGQKNTNPEGTPDNIPVCVGGTDNGIPISG